MSQNSFAPLLKTNIITSMNTKVPKSNSFKFNSMLDIELNLKIPEKGIKKINDVIKALVNDYLETNYDGLNLQTIEKELPEYAI
jgi:hypothetical protein